MCAESDRYRERKKYSFLRYQNSDQPKRIALLFSQKIIANRFIRTNNSLFFEQQSYILQEIQKKEILIQLAKKLAKKNRFCH